MKILLLGAYGQVGWALQRSLAPIGRMKICGREEANLEELAGLRTIVRDFKPEVIVNAAAFTAVDRAEIEPERARLINATAVDCLAQEAKSSGALLIQYSTDYVFNGEKSSYYTESDQVDPINVYGRTKWEGEEAVRLSQCKHFIFRTSWVYALRGKNFIETILSLASSREELSVVCDQIGAPTHADLIADATAQAMQFYKNSKFEEQQRLIGTYHLVAGGVTSWNEYARYVLSIAEKNSIPLKFKSDKVKKVKSEAYPLPAKRPKNSCLSCLKFERVFNMKMPDWRFHVARYMKELIQRREQS